jgi:hypothetical protein
LFNYEKVYWNMDTKEVRNSVNFSENEIITLLDLMIVLGIMLNKVSYYDLESYTEKFQNKFTYKKGFNSSFSRRQFFFLSLTNLTGLLN